VSDTVCVRAVSNRDVCPIVIIKVLWRTPGYTGVKRQLKLQLPFGAIPEELPTQVPVSTEKSAELYNGKPMLLMNKVLEPVLTRVMVCGTLAVPTP
jgi:hypothetical protein